MGSNRQAGLELPHDFHQTMLEADAASRYEGPDANQLPLFGTDNFRIYFMKVQPCNRQFCHDWTICPFSHGGEKAKRRDPRSNVYTGIACVDMKKDGACIRGDNCPYAHNVFEYWLHPTRYRTQLCNDGANCRRRICFFAHTLDELRIPPCKPYVSPEVLAAATAAASGKLQAMGSNLSTFSLGSLGNEAPFSAVGPAGPGGMQRWRTQSGPQVLQRTGSQTGLSQSGPGLFRTGSSQSQGGMPAAAQPNNPELVHRLLSLQQNLEGSTANTQQNQAILQVVSKLLTQVEQDAATAQRQTPPNMARSQSEKPTQGMGSHTGSQTSLHNLQATLEALQMQKTPSVSSTMSPRDGLIQQLRVQMAQQQMQQPQDHPATLYNMLLSNPSMGSQHHVGSPSTLMEPLQRAPSSTFTNFMHSIGVPVPPPNPQGGPGPPPGPDMRMHGPQGPHDLSYLAVQGGSALPNPFANSNLPIPKPPSEGGHSHQGSAVNQMQQQLQALQLQPGLQPSGGSGGSQGAVQGPLQGPLGGDAEGHIQIQHFLDSLSGQYSGKGSPGGPPAGPEGLPEAVSEASTSYRSQYFRTNSNCSSRAYSRVTSQDTSYGGRGYSRISSMEQQGLQFDLQELEREEALRSMGLLQNQVGSSELPAWSEGRMMSPGGSQHRAQHLSGKLEVVQENVHHHAEDASVPITQEAEP